MYNFFQHVLCMAKGETSLRLDVDPSTYDVYDENEVVSPELLERHFIEYIGVNRLDESENLLAIRVKLNEFIEEESIRLKASQRQSLIEILLLDVIFILELITEYRFHNDPRFTLMCSLFLLGIIYTPFHIFSRVRHYHREELYHVSIGNIYCYAELLITLYQTFGREHLESILEKRRSHSSSSE